eukprot:9015415-Lingulodinium_polyedra.AAC.1
MSLRAVARSLFLFPHGRRIGKSTQRKTKQRFAVGPVPAKSCCNVPLSRRIPMQIELAVLHALGR